MIERKKTYEIFKINSICVLMPIIYNYTVKSGIK